MTNSDKLEKVHFRALKYIFQDCNDILLQKAGTTTLHLSKMRKFSTETHHHFCKILLLKRDTSYNFSYTNLLEQPRPKSTRFGVNSFRYQAAKLWNALPDDAKKLTDFDSSRVRVVSNVGVLCAGNCRCHCTLGTPGECTWLFSPTCIYFVFDFIYFSLCLNVKSEISIYVTCSWFAFRLVSRAAWRHTALSILIKWIPFISPKGIRRRWLKVALWLRRGGISRHGHLPVTPPVLFKLTKQSLWYDRFNCTVNRFSCVFILHVTFACFLVNIL